MNALADAAFLSRPDGLMGMPMQPGDNQAHAAAAAAAAQLSGSGHMQYPSAPYSEQEMHAMGLLNGPSGGMNPPLPGSMPPPMPLPAGVRSLLPSAPGGAGRHLQILDHTVHRIDAHTKANGEEEKEMVVSNLRHFNLKIGVLDPRMGVGRDAELPLRAELLYENGQLVEQLATCEPLLVGKTEVVAMQGTALFKLRITSLSSHRDKQRFRIRVSPADTSILLREPVRGQPQTEDCARTPPLYPLGAAYAGGPTAWSTPPCAMTHLLVCARLTRARLCMCVSVCLVFAGALGGDDAHEVRHEALAQEQRGGRQGGRRRRGRG